MRRRMNGGIVEGMEGVGNDRRAEVGVQRVPVAGGRCWLCGLPAVAGERLPGRRRRQGHRVRLLCARHDTAVFGSDSAADAEHATDAPGPR